MFTKDFNKFKTQKYKLHILRSIFSAGSFLCATKALSGLQLYSYKSIYFLAPIFTATLGVLFLKEKITKWHILAFILCLIGVYSAFKPGNDVFSQFGCFAVGASICSSLAILVFKRMSGTESTESIIFYYSICSICISGFLTDFRNLNLNFSDLYLFGFQALLHLIASFLYTHGLRSQKLSTIAIINYCTLPMSILLGWMIWKDFPTEDIFFASLLIIAGNTFLIYNQLRTSISTE